MTWLAWRQFRGQAIAGAATLALLGGLMLLTAPGLAGEYADGLALCASQCVDFKDQFIDKYLAQQLSITALVLIVPALVGIFWGAPLVASEFDAGTHRLAWNQSVTRTHWLAVKLAMVGGAGAAVTGLLTWAATRWSDPLREASLEVPSLPWPMTFASHGVVPVGYALFAFALGVAVGILVRRALPAMMITLAAFAVVQVAVPVLVRPYLAPIVTETVEIVPTNLLGLAPGPEGGVRIMARSPDPGGWLLSSYTVDELGRKVDAIPLGPEDPVCAPGQGSFETCTAEMTRLGYRQVSEYHPASQYWRLQWTEAGLYGALTAVLVGVSLRWLRRRVV